uniref:Ig-like domain-containing protein n=1 Tax=Macrostomum lignano TaxID=282301 RepID=A0A1I8IHK7_9PLAT
MTAASSGWSSSASCSSGRTRSTASLCESTASAGGSKSIRMATESCAATTCQCSWSSPPACRRPASTSTGWRWYTSQPGTPPGILCASSPPTLTLASAGATTASSGWICSAARDTWTLTACCCGSRCAPRISTRSAGTWRGTPRTWRPKPLFSVDSSASCATASS